MSYGYDNLPFKEKEIKVRKAQSCHQCHRVIPPGEWAFLEVWKEKRVQRKEGQSATTLYNNYSCAWCCH
jgi:hypothetical protein